MLKYVSDCKNIYSGIKPGGMLQNLFQVSDYATADEACQNCSLGSDVLTNNLGYTYGGSCATASSVQDGNGYISEDGISYYQDSSLNANFPINDHYSPMGACNNPKSLGERFAENNMTRVSTCTNSGSTGGSTGGSAGESTGNWWTNYLNTQAYGSSSNEQAMINSAISGGYAGINSEEYFGSTSKKHSYIMVIVVLLILAAVGFFIYKSQTKPKMMMMGCGMNFF